MANCRHCDNPATKYCRAHRRYLCDGDECAGFHRRAFRPDFCVVVDAKKPFDWMKWLLAFGGLAVAVIATGMAYVHLVRIP